MSTLINDIKYAFRRLWNNPGFTVVAVLMLTVGIGANTAIFSLIEAYILNPVPIKNERRLIEINEIDCARQMTVRISPPLYNNLVQQQNLFEKVVSFQYESLEIAGSEFLEHVPGARVTSNFFDLFGISPLLGHGLTTQEKASSVQDVLVISYALWQSHFGGAKDVIGRILKSKDKIYTIVGVMPAHFQFPSRHTQYWQLFRFHADELSDPDYRRQRSYYTFALLAPNVSRFQAQAFLDTLSNRLAENYPRMCKDYTVRARPLRDFFVAPELRKTLWSVTLAICLVLFIVCANLANLQLSRVEARSKEISVRMALGAGRRRIVRQLLTESLLLSLAGGACGLLLACWLCRLLDASLAASAPVIRPAGFDVAMLVWTFGISIVCAVAFGLYPAWHNSGTRLGRTLQGALTTTPPLEQKWFRYSLVIGEIALTMVLLTGAGLLVRSVVEILQVDTGLNPRHLASVSFRVPDGLGYHVAMRELTTRLAALPGITGVGVGPISGSESVGDYYLPDHSEPVTLGMNKVAVGEHDFFRTIGARLKVGRWLELSDIPEGQNAVIINETLASMCWPGENAVGKRVYLKKDYSNDNPGRFFEIVGVVQDFYTWSLEWERLPILFVPDGREKWGGGSETMYVRTTLDPASFIAGVRRITREVMPNTVAPRIVWIERQLYTSTVTRRLFTGFLSAFAGIGLFLSLLGILGVLTYAVVRRTKEIGVRMALGAQSRDVVAQVMCQGMKLISAGILIGIIGALAWARIISSFLYDVDPIDPATLVCVALLLGFVGLLACYLPARRAAKIDPIKALRYE